MSKSLSGQPFKEPSNLNGLIVGPLVDEDVIVVVVTDDAVVVDEDEEEDDDDDRGGGVVDVDRLLP